MNRQSKFLIFIELPVITVSFIFHRRLGTQQGSTRFIIQHDFFDNLDIPALSKCEMKAPYIPVIKTAFDIDADDIPNIRPYDGDQKLFDLF